MSTVFECRFLSPKSLCIKRGRADDVQSVVVARLDSRSFSNSRKVFHYADLVILMSSSSSRLPKVSKVAADDSELNI